MSALGNGTGFTTSNLYANTNLNMNNQNIINLKDSIDGQEQQAITRKQGYRIGESICSNISNLQTTYPYLIRQDGQTFNTTTYPVLYSRLGTNVLIYGYKQFASELIVYDAVPATGVNVNFMVLTWPQIVANCDRVLFELQDGSRVLLASHAYNSDFIVGGNTPSYATFHQHLNPLNIADKWSGQVTVDTTSGFGNQFGWGYTNLNAARLRITLQGLKNNLQQQYMYVVAQ